MKTKIESFLKSTSPRQRMISGTSGLLLFLVLFATYKWGCTPTLDPATTPTTGTLLLSATAQPIVYDAISHHSVFAEDMTTGEKTYILTPDTPTELPPGTYSLQTKPGTQFSFQDPEFTIALGGPTPHGLLIKFVFPWKVPMLPAVSGAYAEWTGTMVRTVGDAEMTLSYSLSMETLGEVEVEVDRCRCRWLKVEVETKSVKETAFLAVDINQWETRQEFKVKRGWMTARTADIASELEIMFASADGENGAIPPEEITVAFNEQEDVLAQKAQELGAPLPVDRLSLLDALTLVMDADFTGASEQAGQMRAVLSNLDEVVSSDVRAGNNGELNCLVVRSRPESEKDNDKMSQGPSMFVELARSDPSVPFSFMRVHVSYPNLEATLNLDSYFLPAAVSAAVKVPAAPDIAALDDAAKLFAELPDKPRFDLATIPRENGPWVMYEGHIDFGPSRRILYTARIEALASVKDEEKEYRWLKLEIHSGPNGGGLPHSETAIVLIDPEAYVAEGAADILDGWFVYRNHNQIENANIDEHVLKFDPDGDMTQTLEDLQMLGCEVSPERLTVHDVLALLFNARLPRSPSIFRPLRSAVSAKLKNSDGRTMTRQDLALKNRTTVPGKVWKFAGDDHFSYTFERSDKVPFSFISLNLTYESVKLFANLESNVPPNWPAPQPFDQRELEQRSKDTQKAGEDWQTENVNFRFWTLTTENPKSAKIQERVFAEWAGESKPRRGALKGVNFFLKLRSGNVIPYARNATQLSKLDENWITEGRFWEVKNWKAEGWGEQTHGSRARFSKLTPKGKNPPKLELNVRNLDTRHEEKVNIPLEQLSDTDRTWAQAADSY